MKKDSKKKESNSAPAQQSHTLETSQILQPVIRRENYCKFNQVEQRLKHHLEVATPIKEAANDLGISLSTFHKYQCFCPLNTTHCTGHRKQ